MKSILFPLSGGSYRVVDGALVRDDDAPAAPAPDAAPTDTVAASTDSNDTASRGRRLRTREE